MSKSTGIKKVHLKAYLTRLRLISMLPAIFLISYTHPFAAQPDALTLLSRRLGESFIADPEHTGISIGVIKNDSTYFYNFGTISRVHRRPPDQHTIYEIASITKTFTSIILAHAVLEKKIRLDDDVHRYLDRPFRNLFFKGMPVTILNLANHTSGLPKFVPGPGRGMTPSQINKRFNDLTEARFLAELGKVRIDTVPGTRFNYSNAGTQLLGIILERVYHLSYARLVQKYITGPEQMPETVINFNEGTGPNFAIGYNEKGERMPALTWWRDIPAAGGISSSVANMLKYLRLNMNEHDPAIRLTHQPTFQISAEGGNNIGLNWFLKTTATGEREVYHAGGSFGSTSFCAVCPGHKTGVVILANDASPNTEKTLTKMADEILKLIN